MKPEEFCDEGDLFRRRYFCRILVAELAADQRLVMGLAPLEILLIFALQYSRTLGKTVRVDFSHARKMLRNRRPELTHLYPAALADFSLLCRRCAQVCVYRIQYRCRVGVEHPLLVVKPARTLDNHTFVVCGRPLVCHYRVNKCPRLGLRLRVNIPTLYFRPGLRWQPFNGIERLPPITPATNTKLRVLFAIIHQNIICHNPVGQFRVAYAERIAVKLHIFSIFVAVNSLIA